MLRRNIRIIRFIFILFLWGHDRVIAQSLNTGFPVLEEMLRRKQLTGDWNSDLSFQLRPIKLYPNNAAIDLKSLEAFRYKEDAESGESTQSKHIIFNILPFRNTTTYNSVRPYGWGDGIMIPNVGLQNYTSLGFYAKFYVLNIQFQPEFVTAQNLPYNGFPNDFTHEVNAARFRFWNVGDYPERFGEASFSRFWWGQSKISIGVGAFELGISSENIWWGPGQFNTLTIGNNAQGFPHLTLNTTKPAKTQIGTFEGQLIIGRLEDSQLDPSQHPELNHIYFRRFSGDHKYLNGITISYQPKWTPGLFVGFNRTYQQYEEFRGNELRDWLPVLDPFQKVQLGFDRDLEGKDQQVTFFGRYVFEKANAEIYAEYGRRDHAYNWREFILNPDHARAYLMGFNKLIPLTKSDRWLQIRGEMTHQQESVNRYIRYLGLTGGLSWHTHTRARGFSNYGQALGVGIGTGSNVQTLEVSQVQGLNKFGVVMERLVNNNDFYYRAFTEEPERKPWVDLSLGVLWDKHWNNLLLSSKLQMIQAHNYQWQLDIESTPEFPIGKKQLSVYLQLHLVYSLQ